MVEIRRLRFSNLFSHTPSFLLISSGFLYGHRSKDSGLVDRSRVTKTTSHLLFLKRFQLCRSELLGDLDIGCVWIGSANAFNSAQVHKHAHVTIFHNWLHPFLSSFFACPRISRSFPRLQTLLTLVLGTVVHTFGFVNSSRAQPCHTYNSGLRTVKGRVFAMHNHATYTHRPYNATLVQTRCTSANSLREYP